MFTRQLVARHVVPAPFYRYLVFNQASQYSHGQPQVHMNRVLLYLAFASITPPST